MASLYETHIPVSKLARSIGFYSEVVGLIPAFAQPERGVAFFWVGDKAGGMIGLWSPESAWGWQAGQRHRCHLAVQVTLAELEAAHQRLAKLDLVIRGFDDAPASEPSVIGWMPSAQIYFNDPDDHSIELISLLDGPSRPSFLGTWSRWRALQDDERSLNASGRDGEPGITRGRAFS